MSVLSQRELAGLVVLAALIRNAGTGDLPFLRRELCNKKPAYSPKALTPILKVLAHQGKVLLYPNRIKVTPAGENFYRKEAPERVEMLGKFVENRIYSSVAGLV